jgi:Zn-dependent metalloprotease
MVKERACSCFIVPAKVLLHFKDVASALLSERLRGARSATPPATLTALSTGEMRRTIYDARRAQALPGKLVRGEGAPASADKAVNDAYDSAGETYAFYKEILHRNSIDGRGLRLDSTVHYARNYNNAFWNGNQMVYGDGDKKLFENFTSALDVVAHELTHGVTQYTVPGGGLNYEDQSGALNESMSDVFGSLVKQWKLKQTAAHADWLIGAGIMVPPDCHALRSMKDPGNQSLTWPGDDQPKTMAGYVEGGDVHTNSGIPNHAFYLAATAIGGHAWEKTGRIWYRALRLLTFNATFADAAEATVQAAGSLFGASSKETTDVKGAWKQVGVLA